jgi:alcohol dehydrogenase (cytochrome c)
MRATVFRRPIRPGADRNWTRVLQVARHATQVATLVCLLPPSFGAHAQPSASDAGGRSFETRCAVCHGGDGNGSDRAPSLLDFIAGNSDQHIAALIRAGVRAMPPHDIGDPEMAQLLAFLHQLRPPGGTVAAAPQRRTVPLDGGEPLQGKILDETNFNLALAADDGRIHLLERTADGYREPPVLPKADWPRYDGSFTSNRHSALDQINAANVRRLALQWMFAVDGAPRLEATPVVVDGIMYVTAVNAVFALDARSGRQLWAYRRPRTQGLLGEAAGGANRGVGIGGGRVVALTDNAHLIALDAGSGRLIWDVAMTDWPESQYSASAAPLVIGKHVVTGVAGGEEGARGFVASYDLEDGRREWQFWTIPKPGERLSDTWVGHALEHGCGATWMSGSYDPDLDLVYWAVGNPCPDFNGAERKGSNLYTDSVLALKPDSGALQWYFQFTPHDTHDYDAAEPLVLVDDVHAGRPRRLLVQANRNGFFFVLDRTDGKFLSATPFVSKVTWASGYTQAGAPIPRSDGEPTPEGNLACPAAGTNWMSASYDPRLQLFYFSVSDRCGITRLRPEPFEMGKRYFNGTGSAVPGGTRSVRALDIRSGRTVWDYEQVGTGRSSSGTLSTQGGLVFFGEDSGVFTALDARTGKPLWHFSANNQYRASPMTYMVGGKQFVCIASAAGYLAFALADPD